MRRSVKSLLRMRLDRFLLPLLPEAPGAAWIEVAVWGVSR